MKTLAYALAAVAALALALFAAGRFGLLQGQAPALGVRDGKLTPPSPTPNSVSSQAHLWPHAPQREYAAIAPFPVRGEAATALARLRAIVAAMPGARVIEARDDYLYAQFTTRWLRFVDDAEFWVDPAAGVVQVRSASRLGRGDLGVNRTRIEALRSALAAPAT
jgi:uncharacterized protein (DUF1499 family)